jgi:hypothetical protein
MLIRYNCALLSKTMPVKKGNKLVEIKEQVIRGLMRVYGSGMRAAPDFTTFINELLVDVIRREDFLSQYKPFSHLTYAGARAGNIFIRDKQRKLIAAVILKDGLLFCESPDADSDCDHVRFATSLIDVAKYLHEHKK